MPLSCASPEALDAPPVDELLLPDTPALGVLLLVPVLGDVLLEVEPLLAEPVLGAEAESLFGVLVAELGV